jgi:chromatin segregation and condensation protein Rec8/ScpA/Scc1 (kleisin family)
MDASNHTQLFEEITAPDGYKDPCHHHVADEEDEAAEEQPTPLIEEIITPDGYKDPCHHYVADEEDDVL